MTGQHAKPPVAKYIDELASMAGNLRTLSDTERDDYLINVAKLYDGAKRSLKVPEEHTTLYGLHAAAEDYVGKLKNQEAAQSEDHSPDEWESLDQAVRDAEANLQAQCSKARAALRPS